MIARQCAVALWLLLILFCHTATAQDIQFPPLTGRVVDQANMLDAASEQQIAQMLEEHERATSNQIVVVTLPDLQGRTIEEFGYQLGRHWGIGQKNKDNGALLVIAKAERKVRIEVGYGLEGALTDAISSDIVHRIIVPEFKRGGFEDGIGKGVEAMMQAVAGEYSGTTEAEPTDTRTKALVLFLVFGGWLALAAFTSVGGRRGGRGLIMLGAMGALGGRRGGGFGGGGFGGGGGGFGGGGASGGW